MTVDFFGTFPALHPGWIILIYVVVPWIPILLGVHFIAPETSWKGGRIYSFICNLILFLYRFAPVIVVANVFWSGIILINQASYAYRQLSLNRNPNYFLSVDLTSFNALNAITSATISNSYNAITRLTSSSSSRRRLQTDSAVDSTLTLIYHTNDFDDLVTADTFQQLCRIELSILNDNSSCINRGSSRYDSILPQYYNLPDGCAPTKVPINFYWNLLSQMNNARFVEDSIDLVDPSTSVVISYFDVGTCADDYSPKDFTNYLSRFTNDTNIQITWANDALNRQDIDDATNDAGYYLTLSAIVCEIILIFALRGFVMSLMTMACFFFALINAASFLPTIGYDYFSVLNLGTFLILMAYGSSIAVMFASAWRRQVKPAAHPTVANILNAYATIGLPFLYLTMLGMICCFCLLVSPAVIIQQFGAFTGFTILFYYLIFHYVFLPTWICTSWFIFSKKTHRKFRYYRSLCCPCYDPIVQYFKAQKGWTTAAIIAEFVPDIDDDEDFLDDDEDEEDEMVDAQGVVHASEVQIITRNDTTMSMHQRLREDPDEMLYEEDEEVLDDQSRRGNRRGRSGYSRANMNEDHTELDEEEGEEEGNGEEIIESSVAGGSVRGGNTNNSRPRPDLTPIREGEIEDSRHYTGERGGSSRGGPTHLSASSTLIPPPPNTEEVVAAAAPVSPDDEQDPALAELEADTNFCRGKRPLKLFGFVVLIMVIIGILIVYIISIQKFRLDLGMDSMVHDLSSNLGYQYQIVENYKFDVMTSHQTTVSPTTIAPSRAPTRAPLSLRPTRAPTPLPSIAPSIGTRAPSRPPTTDNYLDYVITGCWGVDYDKTDQDSDVTATYDYSQFQRYVNNGLVTDMFSLCQYVQNNQIALDIHPGWDVDRDCIYYQYQQTYQKSASRTTNDVLLSWAQTNYLTGSLLGIASNSSTTQAVPVWVCANFSIRSYLDTVGSDPQYIIDLEQTWRDTFELYSINARRQGIPMQLSSPMFTYPVLSHQQQTPAIVAIAATVVGFTGLLWLLTLSDYGLTVFGSLTIFTIIIIVICIHLFVQNSKIDIFDYIVVTCLILLLSHLPIQLIEEYQQARRLMDQQQMVRADKALSPALALTNKYFRQSVVMPVFLIILISIAPLYARFEILRRIASYIIILAIVCLVMTICFEPYLLAFGCRTKHCEALCYVEVEEEDPNAAVGGTGRRPVIRHESSALDNSPGEQPTEILDDDRRSNLSRSTNRSGSRYRSGRLPRPASNASVSTHNSRQPSIDSRQSAGVMSLYGGSVNSGFQPPPPPGPPGSFYRAPTTGTPYGPGVADPDYHPYAMTTPPPAMMMNHNNVSMYYPAGGGYPPPGPPIGHPLALPRYHSSQDPRVLMHPPPNVLPPHPYTQQPPPPPPGYYNQVHDPYLFRAARQTPPTHPGGGGYPPYPGQTHPNQQYPPYPPQSRPYSNQSRSALMGDDIPMATVTAVVPADDSDPNRRSLQM